MFLNNYLGITSKKNRTDQSWGGPQAIWGGVLVGEMRNVIVFLLLKGKVDEIATKIYLAKHYSLIELYNSQKKH